MKSPITGKEMKLVVAKDKLEFRKESFEIDHHHYECEDSGEIFTDEALDTLNLLQAHNQYRERYNIPFPDDIRRLRESYGLSAAKMSEVLGFGANVYRQYEAGEVPSLSNARLLALAKDPEEFKKLVLLSNTYEGKMPDTLAEKLKTLIEKQHSFFSNGLDRYLMQGFDYECPSLLTGYRTPSLEKFVEMVVYFTETVKPWKTKLNKLLFYADFLHFKRTCFGISGAEYVAINMGPVPNNFNSLFEYAVTNHKVDITYHEFANGGVGEVFSPCDNRTFSAELFEETELNAMNVVATTFKGIPTREMVDWSHEEQGWIDNFPTKGKIEYNYAFNLKKIQ